MNQQDLPTPKAPPLNDERDSFIAKMFAKAKNLLWPPAPQIALPGGEPFSKNPESGMFLRQMSDIESMPDVEYSTPIHSPNDAELPSAESEPDKPSGIFNSIWSMGESAMQTESFKKLQKAARTAGLSYALINAGSDSINQSIQMSTLPGAIVANEKTREERDAEWWARVRRREYETPVPADVEQNRHFDEGGEVAKPSQAPVGGDTHSPVPIPSMEPGKSTEPKRSPWLHDRLADMVSPITESSLFKKAAKLYKHYSTAAAFVAAMSGGVPDAIKDSMAEGPSQPRDPITREQKLAEKYEKAVRRKEPHKPKPANFGEADHYDIGGVIKKATKAYHHLTTAAAIATAASGGVPDAIGESMGTAPPNPPITRETRVAEEFEQARRRRAPVRPKPVDKGEPKHLADGGPVSEQGDFHFERTGEGQGVFADASPEELEAAHLYQNTPVYGQMQGYLRGTSDNAGWLSKMWHSLTTPKQAKQAISGMDSLMDKSSLPEMTVHRAMVIPEAGEDNRDIEKLPGKTITEPGFASTSVDPASIENFMVRSDRVRGEIHVPSGAQGVSLHPDDTGIKTKWAQEKEILLPRGSSFKVDEVDRDPDQRWRVKMDLLPKDEPSEPRRDGQEALADVQHAADGGKIAGTREILAERGEVVVKPSEAKKPENRAVLEAMNADRGGVPRVGAMSADVPTIPGAPADKTDGGEIHQHLGTPGKDNEPVKVAEEAFVVNAGAAQKPENKEILQSINAGTVPHFDGGGEVNASADTPKSPVEHAVATWRALYDRVTDPKLTYPEIDATIAEPFQDLTIAQLKEVGAGIGKTIMPGNKAKMVAQFVRMVKDQKENWERLQPRTPHMDEGGEVPVDASRPSETRPSEPQRSKPAPVFYSRLQKAIEELGDKPIPAEAVKNRLKKAGKEGFSDEEWQWTGMDAAIEGKKSVTRDELLKHFGEKQMQVGEVVKGENLPGVPFNYRLYSPSGEPGGILTPGEHDEMSEETRNRLFSTFTFKKEPIHNPKSVPEFSGYQTPGGDNYREMLLTLPEKEQDDFVGSHWKEPNVLAHIRMNDRVGKDGEKILHVEEIQSDWHQEGREKGYIGQLPQGAKIIPISEKSENLAYQKAAGNGWKFVVEDAEGVAYRNGYGQTEKDALANARIKSDSVPDVPFKENWHELALKRVIRHAAENDYARITLNSGEQINKVLNPGGGDEGSLQGQKAFYDTTLPNTMAKLGKPFGAKVEPYTISEAPPIADYDRFGNPVDKHGKPIRHDDEIGVTSLPITPELKTSAINKGFAHMAEGGPVSTPIKATAGEFMVSPEPASRFRPLLNAINNDQTKTAPATSQHLATGGAVDAKKQSTGWFGRMFGAIGSAFGFGSTEAAEPTEQELPPMAAILEDDEPTAVGGVAPYLKPKPEPKKFGEHSDFGADLMDLRDGPAPEMPIVKQLHSRREGQSELRSFLRKHQPDGGIQLIPHAEAFKKMKAEEERGRQEAEARQGIFERTANRLGFAEGGEIPEVKGIPRDADEVPVDAQPGAFVVRKEQASKFKPILHAIENNQLAADAPQHLDRGGEIEAKPHTAPSRDGRAFPVPPGAEPAAQSSLPSEPDRHGWFDLPEAERDLFSLPTDSVESKPSEPSKQKPELQKPELQIADAPSEPVRMGIPAMPVDPALTERQQESHDKEAYYRATGDDFLADSYRKANEFDANQAAKSVSGPEPAVSGPAVSGPAEPVRHAIPAPPVDPLLSPARQANRDKIDFHGAKGNTSEADFYKRIDKLDAERESRPVPMAIPASPVNPSMPRERQKVRDEIEYHEKTGNPRKANERRSLDRLMEEASKPRKPAAPVTAAVAEANAEQLERRAKDTFNQTQREGYEENAARWRAQAEELRADEAARAAEVSEPNAAPADDAGAVPEAIRAEDVPEPSPKKRKDNSRHPILKRAVAAGLERSFPAIYGQQDDESQPRADNREDQDLTPEEIKKQKRESRYPLLTRAVAEGLKYLLPSIYDQKDEDAIKPNRSSPQEDQPMMFPRKEEQISLGETSKASGNSLSDNKELLAAINALVAEIKELRRDLKAETPGIKPDGSFVPGLNMAKSPGQEIPLKARDKDASRVAAVQSARNIWRQTQ